MNSLLKSKKVKTLALMCGILAVGAIYAPGVMTDMRISEHKFSIVSGNPHIPESLRHTLASITTTTTEGMGMCSGELVAPGTVLTAGHCVGSDLTAVAVEIKIDGVVYTPVGSLKHPDADKSGRDISNADCGFYYLTKEAMTTGLDLHFGSAAPGQHASGAGFGAADYAQLIEGNYSSYDVTKLGAGYDFTPAAILGEGGFSGTVMHGDDGSINGILVAGPGDEMALKILQMAQYRKDLEARGYISSGFIDHKADAVNTLSLMTNVKHIKELQDFHNHPETIPGKEPVPSITVTMPGIAITVPGASTASTELD